jgi:four helix bundle suffix protein
MNTFLKNAGGYTNWSVYKKSVIICDVTEHFITKYLPSNSRTVDQMRQAARSCKQNIVEGTSDNAVSVETCMKLLGIARGSVRELLEDYGDYLRQHDLHTWTSSDPRTRATREYCHTHYDPAEFVAKCRERSAETVANIMLTEIRQIDAMLAKVLQGIEANFLRDGGIREAMTRARLSARANKP